MRQKLLFSLAVCLWIGWRSEVPEARRPYCGDQICQSGSCENSPPGTLPGDGCEETPCDCQTDCPGTCDVCQPNWSNTYTHIGNASEVWYTASNPPDLWCTYGELYHVHAHDNNFCFSDRDYCEYFPLAEEHHIPYDNYCCDVYGCWGTQYCPY